MTSLADKLRAAGTAQPGGLRFLLSAHASHEELFLFRCLTDALTGSGVGAATVSWRYRPKPQHARFAIPAVDAPNVNGARQLGFVSGNVGDGVAEADVSALRTAVEAGHVSALYVFDSGPDGSLGDVQWVIDARTKGTLPLLIVQGVLQTSLMQAADFVLPGASYVEKEASYTNDQGRLQAAARVDSDAWRGDGGLADSRQSHHGARRWAGLQDVRRRAVGDRGCFQPAGPRRRRLAAVQPTDGGPSLAAGVKPVRALEVGFHVPGSAAD